MGGPQTMRQGENGQDTTPLGMTFYGKVFPNPFNPNINIEYFIPSKKPILNGSITAYNIAGRIVKHFTNVPRSSGYHQITWNGKDDGEKQLASGSYILVMRFDKNVSHHFMVMTK
jgi:flagellar hook assembly protein FlgD